MADNRDDDRDGREERREGDDYKVGRNRPPEGKRYRKGKSGNPKGRPKGSRNLKTDLVNELAGKIAINEGGRKKVLRKQQAMIKRAIAQAIQGDTKAMNNVISMMMKLMGDEVKAEPRPVLNDSQKRVLENYTARLKVEILRDISEGGERQGAPENEEGGDTNV